MAQQPPPSRLTMQDLLRQLITMSQNLRLLAKAQMPTHLSLQREQLHMEEHWLQEIDRLEEAQRKRTQQPEKAV